MNYFKIVIIFTFIGLSISVFSQDIKIGIKGGFTNTNSTWKLKSGENVFDFESDIGNSLWIFAEPINRKYYGLTSEIGFFQQKSKGKLKFENFTSITPYNFKYFSCDIQLKGKIPIADFEPYLLIGPKIDFLVNTNKEVEEVADINKYIYGIRNTVGVSYALRRYGFFIESSYDFNFNKLINHTNKDYLHDFEFYQKTVFLNVGLSIKI